jgi:hypothetical protein
MGLARWYRLLPVLVTASAATDLDLISFLQAIPDAHMRRSEKALPSHFDARFRGNATSPWWQRIVRSATAVPSPGRSAPNRHRSTSVRPRAAPVGLWRWPPSGPATARPSGESIFSSPACTPPQKPCCNWCATAGALRAGAGSMTPSCMRTLRTEAFNLLLLAGWISVDPRLASRP